MEQLLTRLNKCDLEWYDEYDNIVDPKSGEKWPDMISVMGNLMNYFRVGALSEKFYILGGIFARHIKDNILLYTERIEKNHRSIIFIIAMFLPFEELEDIYELGLLPPLFADGQYYPTTIYEYYITAKMTLTYNYDECIPYLKYINMDENLSMKPLYDTLIKKINNDQKRLYNKSARVVTP